MDLQHVALWLGCGLIAALVLIRMMSVYWQALVAEVRNFQKGETAEVPASTGGTAPAAAAPAAEPAEAQHH